ncbi:MAG: enoyl-CoA hydratase [Gammaproteobacteria bacterium]
MTYAHILVERRDAVGLITLNRPKAMNALSNALMAELGAALDELDQDDDIGAIVLTGNEKAFAAGADISDMQGKTATELFLSDYPFLKGSGWNRVNTLRKPIIAAVAGVALGGGCEVAMACDIIIAADNAKFGQPEIRLGTLPGAGGTQRLTRAIGKSKAMEMILTARFMGAEEAERAGLVSRVVPLADLVDEAVKTAQAIAAFSRPAVMAAKECVNAAFEVPLREGLRIERRAFQASFASEDTREGTDAFLNKREARFKNR